MAEVNGGRIAWQATESISLVRVTPGRGLSIFLTGPVVSYYMHWSEEEHRTFPCLLGACPHCVRGDSRRALSYCRSMAWLCRGGEFQWLPAILEVPWPTGVTLSSMCGRIVALKRDRKHGPVNVGTFLFEQKSPRPVEFDMYAQLTRLWRLPGGRQVALVGNLGPHND